MKIASKDWDRMLDLILTDKDGESVANSIKDKNKAIARFICGLKLNGDIIEFNERWHEFRGDFSCFANKAILLGASTTEIQEAFDATVIPQSILDRRSLYNGKKMNSWVVSYISKAIIDAGFDINYLNDGGNAITPEGKWAMERNGRKWTIGYRTEVIANGITYDLIFDAITCEGGGPSSYVMSTRSNNIFGTDLTHDSIGKVKFTQRIIQALKQVA
jgi:hypothetical protein